MGNCAPQFHELHHAEYPQFENQVLHPSSYGPLPQKSSLEDTLKEFMEITSQSTIQMPQPELSLADTFKAFIYLNSQIIQEIKNVIMVDSQAVQEIKDATMANTSSIERLEGELDRLVAELNRMEEEELQSQLRAERHYMIDENENDMSNPYHEHVQATTTLGSEEVVEEIVNKPSLKDPLEESFAQFEFDLDLDMISVQAEALLASTPEIRPENGETTEISSLDTSSSATKEEEKDEHLESVEHLEQIEPSSTPTLSNDKEVSTETHCFITIPLETLHEPQASVLQYLKESFYNKLVKDLCIQGHKSRNHLPKNILRSKQVGYLRGRNIMPEGYQILKKKWWKRLVGHPNDRGKYGVLMFKFGGRPGLFHTMIFPYS
jgi:hypothetical protein